MSYGKTPYHMTLTIKHFMEFQKPQMSPLKDHLIGIDKNSTREGGGGGSSLNVGWMRGGGWN